MYFMSVVHSYLPSRLVKVVARIWFRGKGSDLFYAYVHACVCMCMYSLFHVWGKTRSTLHHDADVMQRALELDSSGCSRRRGCSRSAPWIVSSATVGHTDCVVEKCATSWGIALLSSLLWRLSRNYLLKFVQRQPLSLRWEERSSANLFW